MKMSGITELVFFFAEVICLHFMIKMYMQHVEIQTFLSVLKYFNQHTIS